jgi:hypothetical protein
MNDTHLSAAWRKSSHCANSNCVEVAVVNGEVAMRDAADPTGPVLEFSAERWNEFVKGAEAGEFDR